jgi:hypothetical protein
MGRDREWLFKAIGLAAVAAICAMAMRLWTGYPGNPKGETSLMVALVVVTLTALGQFLMFIWRLWRSGASRPIAAIRARFPSAAVQFAPIAIGVLTIGTFLFSLSYLKAMITAVVPFWADAPLAALDRSVGLDPQGIALALSPTLPALGFFYGLWHAAHLGGILWVLHWRSGKKARHIVSFMLTWSIGMAFAYIFSSAGPLFTGVFDPAVAPQSVQTPAAILWANYQAHGAVIGGGISAFPSLHVAIATWFALVLRDRGYSRLGSAYALAIFACSVILGWHYAADGLAGAGIALLADRLSVNWLSHPRSSFATFSKAPAIPN